MTSFRTPLLGGALTLILGAQSWASDGDGPGTAIIKFPDDELKMYGTCIDWAFRTGEGVPNLILEAETGAGDVPVFRADARLSLEGSFWEIKEVDRFEPKFRGYVLAGTFADLKSTRDPEPVTISVVCD